MILPIDDETRIQTDDRSWQVAKRKWSKKHESYDWQVITWHRTLEQAVRSLYQSEIRASEAYGYTQALAASEDALRRLSAALTPDFTVTRTGGAA